MMDLLEPEKIYTPGPYGEVAMFDLKISRSDRFENRSVDHSVDRPGRDSCAVVEP